MQYIRLLNCPESWIDYEPDIPVILDFRIKEENKGKRVSEKENKKEEPPPKVRCYQISLEECTTGTIVVVPKWILFAGTIVDSFV